MKVGINSAIIKEISGRGLSLDELPVEVVEIGFDDIPLLTEKGINWNLIEELLTLGVEFTIHAPCSDGKNISLDLGVDSRRNIRIMEDVFRISQALNAKYVVIHGGDIRKSYYTSFVNTKRQLMELSVIGEEYGVKLEIENLLDNRIGAFPHEFLPFLDENVSTCFDVGHAFLVSRKYGIRLEEFLLIPDIEHVHLHDNSGFWDEHRALGEGVIPFNVILPAIAKIEPKNVILEIRRYRDSENVIRSIELVKKLKPRVKREVLI
ncbi:sugar phosphate isomerase/epimerase family protein [Pyrococcus abyssi]|nr:sugar phosphate isomerase/epimerase [Pyrococcus abyssi]CCE70454.1 TPA: hypothetical protein PAB0696 [Pyrococcus abyssi GE5]